MKYDGFYLDAHAHVLSGVPGLRQLLQTEREYGYSSCNVLGTPVWSGASQNAQCLAVKLLRTDCYAFAGLNHAQGDFARQCRFLMDLGADGFKMIEGKPDVYRKVGQPLNAPYYDALYQFSQDHGIPILAHVGDPPEFWDPKAAPAFAVENGWLYTDGAYPALGELFAQVEEVLGRYPRLPLILAHFFFHSHWLDQAAAFLDRHPSVCFDLCPGTEMYETFSRDPGRARDFFLRYQDRLLFGTDNWDTEDPQEVRDKREINRMVHLFLQTKGEFRVWDHEMRGIDLPVPVLEKIYERNFRRLAGERPRPLNQELLERHCREILAHPERFDAASEDGMQVKSVLDALAEKHEW